MGIQETSVGAYRDVKPTLAGKHAEFMAELAKHKNATNLELSQRLGWPINTITPRTLELRKKGLVVEDERRHCKVSGRRAIAWKVLTNTLF